MRTGHPRHARRPAEPLTRYERLREQLNFRELADRFEQLSQVLPDALRLVQEVKELQGATSQRLEVLEGRMQSEEAYLTSLQELQEAVISQSGTIQDDIKVPLYRLPPPPLVASAAIRVRIWRWILHSVTCKNVHERISRSG